MARKSYSFPLAMVTNKFYCHKCGTKLVRYPRTRTVKRGDPDYKEHSRIGHWHTVGDVEVTEYDFKCLDCERITEYDEQCVLSIIQKKMGRRTLSTAEVAENIEAARA